MKKNDEIKSDEIKSDEKADEKIRWKISDEIKSDEKSDEIKSDEKNDEKIRWKKSDGKNPMNKSGALGIMKNYPPGLRGSQKLPLGPQNLIGYRAFAGI